MQGGRGESLRSHTPSHPGTRAGENARFSCSRAGSNDESHAPRRHHLACLRTTCAVLIPLLNSQLRRVTEISRHLCHGPSEGGPGKMIARVSYIRTLSQWVGLHELPCSSGRFGLFVTVVPKALLKTVNTNRQHCNVKNSGSSSVSSGMVRTLDLTSSPDPASRHSGSDGPPSRAARACPRPRGPRPAPRLRPSRSQYRSRDRRSRRQGDPGGARARWRGRASAPRRAACGGAKTGCRC